MKNLFVFCLFALIVSACGSNEEIVPQNDLKSPESSLGGGCLMSYSTNPDDGPCPSQYDFSAFAPGGCTSYSWSVSGDAYFSGGTTSQTASIIVQRDLYTSGSFTISANIICGGVLKTCSRTFTVDAENTCI